MATPFTTDTTPSSLQAADTVPLSPAIEPSDSLLEKELDKANLSELDDNNSDNDTSLTAANFYQGLLKAWQNEAYCPELLPFKSDYIDCMMEVVAAIEKNLKDNKINELLKSLHLLELERVKYVMASYLRKRLEKIEKFSSHIIGREEEMQKLSKEEEIFLTEYLALQDGLLSNLVVRHMPQNLQVIDRKKHKNSPNLDEFVFVKAIKDIKDVSIGDDVITFKKGICHIIRYSEIQYLVQKGDLELV